MAGSAAALPLAGRAASGQTTAGASSTLRFFPGFTSARVKTSGADINLVDPDIVVVGGGLSRIEPLYAEVPRRWADWVFSDVVTTPIVPARYGDASGVRGAAWLWNERMLP